MPSFDIVSRTDMQEVDNAVQSMRREISTRYDFKDSKCSIERNEEELTILADDDFKLKQLHEILRVHFAKRKVDWQALDMKTPEKAAGQSLRQKITVKQGIETEIAKQITKLVKESKIKVNASIKGEEIRVEGKKRDDLQEVMSLLRGASIELPLQFVNFRD